MNDLSEILSSIEGISLSEMDGVKLLDRVDRKFMFNIRLFPEILEALKNDYKILDVNGVRMNGYETLYFDTPEFKMYLDHHNGRLNRFKVRIRRYTESDLCFFEIKQKKNTGRTLKYRIVRANFDDRVTDEELKMFHRLVPEMETLIPVMQVNYRRITLVNRKSTERLTFDLGLTFSRKDRKTFYSAIVIAEVKQNRMSDSPFVRVIHAMHIHKVSLSKYCLGIISLFDTVRKNNFYTYNRKLNKISHEEN